MAKFWCQTQYKTKCVGDGFKDCDSQRELLSSAQACLILVFTWFLPFFFSNFSNKVSSSESWHLLYNFSSYKFSCVTFGEYEKTFWSLVQSTQKEQAEVTSLTFFSLDKPPHSSRYKTKGPRSFYWECKGRVWIVKLLFLNGKQIFFLNGLLTTQVNSLFRWGRESTQSSPVNIWGTWNVHIMDIPWLQTIFTLFIGPGWLQSTGRRRQHQTTNGPGILLVIEAKQVFWLVITSNF